MRMPGRDFLTMLLPLTADLGADTGKKMLFPTARVFMATLPE
jgi:hypothetical protein